MEMHAEGVYSCEAGQPTFLTLLLTRDQGAASNGAGVVVADMSLANVAMRAARPVLELSRRGGSCHRDNQGHSSEGELHVVGNA